MIRLLKPILKKILPVKIRRFLKSVRYLKDTRASRLRLILFLSRSIRPFPWLARHLARPEYDYRKLEDPFVYLSGNPNKGSISGVTQGELSFRGPAFYPGDTGQTGSGTTQIRQYHYTLYHAEIIGGSSLILPCEGLVLYELKFNDTHGRYRYSDEAILDYDDKGCIVAHQEISQTIPNGISLIANFSWNYFHFLFEVINRFKWVNQLEVPLSWPVCIDQQALEVPQFRQLVDFFNTAGRPVIPVKKGQRCRLEQMIVISSPHILPPNYLNITKVNPSDFLYSFDSLDYVRTGLLKHITGKSYPSRIFLSRSKASPRRKFNEDELFNALSPYGFQRVFPEDLSIAEQVTVFNHAEYIVGGSGAAFTNLLFCSPRCKAICFTNFKLPVSIFSTIAAFVGMDLIYNADDTKTIDLTSDIHESFHLQVDRVTELISHWIGERDS